MTDEELLRQARFAAVFAHAPYSNFPVGAALEGHDGALYRGCNIESTSFGLTVCAERVAIWNAVSAGAKPVRLAVSCTQGDLAQPGSRMPCGACRQVMTDHMDLDARVLVDGVGDFAVSELLPHAFRMPTEQAREVIAET